MQIQWYPGHMHKACKEIKDVLPKIDLIIEVLDARIPFSSQNPLLQTLRGDKACIRLLSKTDLADPELTRQWQTYLEREKGVKTLAISKQEPDKIKRLTALCLKTVPHKGYPDKIIKAMITGIPNVGKSTLINILADRLIAKTGNEPAITKHQQQIRLPDNLVLSDTPGILWPNVENRNSGYRLAATGAIKDTVIDYTEVAFFTVDYLLQYYPQKLKQRFGLSNLPDNVFVLVEQIGQKRGCLRSGKKIDLDKVSKIILNELRSGKIGTITLETPDIIDQELVELAQIRQQKEEKKKRRKNSRKAN